jgi:hypothetical protein
VRIGVLMCVDVCCVRWCLGACVVVCGVLRVSGRGACASVLVCAP